MTNDELVRRLTKSAHDVSIMIGWLERIEERPGRGIVHGAKGMLTLAQRHRAELESLVSGALNAKAQSLNGDPENVNAKGET